MDANADGHPFGDESPEADVAEQSTPVTEDDDDTWQEADRVSSERKWEATEADLIEQVIPVPDEDADFDR